MSAGRLRQRLLKKKDVFAGKLLEQKWLRECGGLTESLNIRFRWTQPRERGASNIQSVLLGVKFDFNGFNILLNAPLNSREDSLKMFKAT